MDIVYQGTKRSGKSKHAIERVKRYLSKGRRVLTNIDVYVEHLALPKNLKYNDLLLRISDVPTAEMLDNLGHGYLRDKQNQPLFFGVPLSTNFVLSEDNYSDDNNGLLIIDEAALSFDSRKWQGDDREKLLQWVIHSGKYGWNVIYIIHDLSTLDKRIREQYIDQIVVHKNFKNLVPEDSRHFFPEFHVATTYSDASKIGTKTGRKGRKFFRSAWTHKAYNTRQRFLAPDMEQLNGVDMRSFYTVLPPQYLGKKSTHHFQFSFATMFNLIPVIVFIASMFWLYSSWNGDKKEDAAAIPVKTQQVQHCDIFASAEHVPSFARIYDKDFLVQMMRVYQVRVLNLFDFAGRPKFTLVFEDNGKPKDQTTDQELAQYGWQSFYWRGGVALTRGDIWVMLQATIPDSTVKEEKSPFPISF